MKLTAEQKEMLDGAQGRAVQKSMQILNALGEIYGAQELIPVQSVQIAGVSYANLGEAGLQFLAEMADGGGYARVLTTLNPAGMDIENWQALGISPEFARNQERVLEAFARMQVITTCSCTPYLFGNTPLFSQHIAWAESSAVAYANSVLGARSNREGGPSALAASLTGVTPAYGLHLDNNRRANLHIRVEAEVKNTRDFGSLGKAIGSRLEGRKLKAVPFISGLENVTLENLKSFCASIATYGGTALFHIKNVTPEAALQVIPSEQVVITEKDLLEAFSSMQTASAEDIDFVSLGCPHLSIKEIGEAARLLQGKQVKKEFWITTSRPTKKIADMMGYTEIIEKSGAKFAVDTCCVVAPIEGRFKAMLTDSAKACYYAYAKNKFGIRIQTFEEVIREAVL